MNNRKRIRIYGYSIIVLFLAVCGEMASYIAIKYVVLPRDAPAFFQAPDIDRESFERYLKIRDPVLGWPSPSQIGSKRFDRSGSRPVPAYPEPGSECVSLYGDSFTYASDVSDMEAWGNVLAQRLGCRVANFGVGGYGTDQSLLRFLGNAKNPSKLVIVGIFPHNILRNVNRYRYFLTGGSALSFKPRFIIDGDELRLVDIPSPSVKQLGALSQWTKDQFAHETFLVGSPDGPLDLAFPFTPLLIKYVLSERVINWIFGQPGWIGFLSEGHSSQALQVTAKIVERFRDHARANDMDLLVLSFPTPASIEHLEQTGSLAMEPLGAILGTRKIRYLDLSKPFLERLRERRFCSILTDPSACKGHFSAEGNEMLADIVYKHVKSRIR